MPIRYPDPPSVCDKPWARQLIRVLEERDRSAEASAVRSLPELPSAATVAPDGKSAAYAVTGTTSITSISGAELYTGKMLILVFRASVTVVNGGSLKIGSNFSATADDVLVLMSDGSSWFQVSRSAN